MKFVSVVEKQVKCFSYHRVMDGPATPTIFLANPVWQLWFNQVRQEVIQKSLTRMKRRSFHHAILISKKEFETLAETLRDLWKELTMYSRNLRKTHDYVKVARPRRVESFKPRLFLHLHNLSAQQ